MCTLADRVGIDGVVSSFAGSGQKGDKDGPAAQAQFNHPGGIAVDPDDNVIVADYGNHRIRMISQGGIVKTVAGNGNEGHCDGAALAASFCFPQGVAVNPVSGEIVVADFGNEMIRAISKEGTVRTMAGTGEAGFDDGPGELATFNQPRGVACDSSGIVFVADRGNHSIRVIAKGNEEGTHEVGTVAGHGAAVILGVGGHAGDEGCEDDCCLPAPMQRKLYSKRATADEEEESAADEDSAGAGAGASSSGVGAGGAAVGRKSDKAKAKATPFGVLEDTTWG